MVSLYEEAAKRHPFCKEIADLLLVSSPTPKIWHGPEKSTCVIDFLRYDSLRHFMDMTGRDIVQAGTTIMTGSSILLNERTKEVLEGQLAIPHPKYKEKEKELKKLGCEVTVTHEHKADFFGNMAHIHFKKCPLKNRVQISKLAKALYDFEKK